MAKTSAPFYHALAAAVIIVAVVFVILYAFTRRRVGARNRYDVDAMRAAVTAAHGKKSLTRIPRRIWTYWEGPENDLVQMCLKRCRRLNPGYTLTVLNPQNVRELIPEFPAALLDHPAFKDSPAHKADIIRCFAIAYHGGIWTDGSNICMKPFDEWLDLNAEFTGFYLESFTTLPEHPVLENWFFASRPGCRFMEEWCWEFARVAEFDSAGYYIQHLTDSNVALQAISFKSYLAMHCAAQRVMQQILPGVGSKGLVLHRAEDGPFHFMTTPEVKWDSKRALIYVIDNWSSLARRVPFHKLRGGERKTVSELDGDYQKRLHAYLNE